MKKEKHSKAKRVMLAHAVYDQFAECYTMEDFRKTRESIYKTLEQIINDDIKPAVQIMEDLRRKHE